MLDDNGGRPTTPLITFRSGAGDGTPLGHTASLQDGDAGHYLSPGGAAVAAGNLSPSNPEYNYRHESMVDHSDDCYEDRPLLNCECNRGIVTFFK